MKNATLVFDLDGTLVDSAPDLVAATNHALADLGLEPIAGATLRATIGFGARRMILEGLNHTGRTLPNDEVDRLLARFLAYYEPNIARESHPFDGAVSVLENFRTHGARLAVCTNKRLALAKRLLRELHLDRLFDAVAGRDSFPVYKPHPDHVLGAIQMAGGDPAYAVMIGDTAIDVAAAKAADVPVIACSFGYSDQPVEDLGADAVIGHFAELDAAVRRLLPSCPNPSG
ncbi:HAD-IA family hydrolase [Hyphomicrobium sp.]|uniref:HAD-IA family hydrolase n=1 Tax=Hyphomicrobium sp. TaxID=82 RepID=UPI003F6EB947